LRTTDPGGQSHEETFTLGRSQGNDPFYNGSINEFRIYDQALTLERIHNNTALGPDLVDFGDAPAPYPTRGIDHGAHHTDSGPTLGANRDVEADGQPNMDASGDDLARTPDDEDGVTFDSIQVGQLDATVTVNVQNAPSGAKLDAWIDFNGDGTWGGPFEQIANDVAVVNGDNTISFDVPSWAINGQTYARFRLSMAGGLGPAGFAADGSWGGPFEHIADSVTVTAGDNTITFDVPSWTVDGSTYARFRLSTASGLGPAGFAADGEVEDYQITIIPPALASGTFSDQRTISTTADVASSVCAADIDSDGDMDVLSASSFDDTVACYENDGSQNFTEHAISTTADGARSVTAADIDADGDLDVLSASSGFDTIAWHENDPNLPPTDIELSNPSLPEGQPPGTVVGPLSTSDPNAGDSHTYSLVAGPGDDGNGLFTIAGSQLKTAAVFDYEAQSSYSVRIRTKDGGGLWHEEAFAITVTNVNENPSITSSATASVAENQKSVIDVESTDPEGDTEGSGLTYSLTGGADQTLFAIEANTGVLTFNTAPDFEDAGDTGVDNTYEVQVTVTDSGTLTDVQGIAVTVTDVNDAPTDIGLSNSSVAENQAVETTIGTFGTTDADPGDTHTYTLVAGAGDTGNTWFTIDDGQLKTNAIFDYETQNTYSIRVRTTDSGGLWHEEAFGVTVSDVNEFLTLVIAGGVA